MDRSIWITRYDLPALYRNEYLAWLHSAYIPRVLARPGVLWAAHYISEADPTYAGTAKGRIKHTTDATVPAGTRFILLFGGETPHAFVNPAPAQFHASMPVPDRRLFGLRSGARSNIFVEEQRVDGRLAYSSDELSPCIQLASFNCTSYQDEDELADWFAQWHLSASAEVPGCVRARKLVSVSGWAKHAVIFEFESLEARNRHFVNHEAGFPERAAWTDRVTRRLIHAPGSPAVARRIWPAVAA
jgi:hypothetical protein